MVDCSKLDDEALLRRMGHGEVDAFTALYQRRHGGVYRFAYQMSGSKEIAEEVTQEVFLALIKSDGAFDAARGTLQSWLFGAARNLVLRHIERNRRYRPLEFEDEERSGEPLPELSVDGTVLDHLTQAERVETLRQAVLNLPLHYREAIVLCDLQEMSYEEAARSLECAVGTVRSRLHRARALLTERLRPQVRCAQ